MRYDRIDEESAESQAILEEIDSKWSEIAQIKVPQTIADQIQLQEDKCNSIFRAKAKVMARSSLPSRPLVIVPRSLRSGLGAGQR